MSGHDPETTRAIRLDAKMEAYKEFERCIVSLENDYKNYLYRRAWKVALNRFKTHILTQVGNSLTREA